VPVRLALNYATPKQAILDKAMLGTGEVANSCIPKLKYWNKSVQAIPYDIDRAKAELQKSSVSSGFSLDMKVASGDTVQQQKAEILQQEWGKIGVKVQISSVDLGTLFTKWTGGDYQALSFPGNVITSDVIVDDEEAQAQFNYGAGFQSLFTGFRDAKAEQLVATATGTLDEDTRRSTFSELQGYGLQKVPVVPLFFVPYRTAVRDKVQGFRTVPTGWWNLGEVWLKA
jgi:ABC-type transport system substrate-binding protein